MLIERGQKKEAMVSYNKALAINPEFTEAQFNLANVFRDLGKQDEAVASYHKILAINLDFAEAQVSLAIYSWVHAKQDDRVNTLSHINPKTFLRSSKTLPSYYVLLKKLTEYRADHPQKYELSKNIPTLFALGESHCLPPAHTSVSLNGTQYRVEPRIIIGCRAWHLENTHTNIYKIQFERISNSLASGEMVVVMFGEIDCRPNEGILMHHKKTREGVGQGYLRACPILC